MQKRLLLLLAGLLVVCLSVPEAFAQTVLKHMRLGNQVESIAYISSGPNAGHIVIADGDSLIAFPTEARGNAQPRKLFDFSACPYGIEPRGVAWIESERQFVFTDPWPAATTTFCFTDHRGVMSRNVVFTWPQDMADSGAYVEGITWIPPDAPRYAGDLMFVAAPTACCSPTALFVITPSGEFVARIELDPNLGLSPFSISYRAPGRLVLGGQDVIWESDLDGYATAGPYFMDLLGTLEGIAVLGSGRVATAAHSSGKLIFLDSSLTQVLGERSFKVGFGLGLVSGLAWNPTTNEFLAWSRDYSPYYELPQIAAIAGDLSSAHRFTDMIPYAGWFWGRMDYLPDENRVAMSRRFVNPAEIDFFDTSGLVDKIVYPNRSFQMRALAYIPPTREFAVSRYSTPTVLEILHRDGTPSRSVDLAAYIPPGGIIFDIAYYMPAGGPPEGEFLVLVTGLRLLRLDFNGNLLLPYDVTTLPANVFCLKAITTGPYAGAFATVDGNNNELFIFTLP